MKRKNVAKKHMSSGSKATTRLKPKKTGAPSQYQPSTMTSKAEEGTSRPMAGKSIATKSPEPKLPMMAKADTNMQMRKLVKTART